MMLSRFPYAAAGALASVLATAAPALGARDDATPLNLDEATPVSQAAEAGGGVGGGLVRTIVGLFVVVGVIYGLHWLLKQVKAGREEKASGAGLSTLATLPLGPNRAMHLVRCGRDIVLMGASEQGLTLIKTYSEADARTCGLFDAVLGEPVSPVPAPRPARPPRAFLTRLRAWTVIG